VRSGPAAALAAVAATGLVWAYVLLGGGDYEPSRVADPCRPRPFRVTQAIGGLTERLALSALDGAACDLRVSREQLVLALGDRRLPGDPSPTRRDAALRSGLRRALDEAQRAGRIGGIAAFVLRQAIEAAPVGALFDQFLGAT